MPIFDKDLAAKAVPGAGPYHEHPHLVSLALCVARHEELFVHVTGCGCRGRLLQLDVGDEDGTGPGYRTFDRRQVGRLCVAVGHCDEDEGREQENTQHPFEHMSHLVG